MLALLVCLLAFRCAKSRFHRGRIFPAQWHLIPQINTPPKSATMPAGNMHCRRPARVACLVFPFPRVQGHTQCPPQSKHGTEVARCKEETSASLTRYKAFALPSLLPFPPTITAQTGILLPAPMCATVRSDQQAIGSKSRSRLGKRDVTCVAAALISEWGQAEKDSTNRAAETTDLTRCQKGSHELIPCFLVGDRNRGVID